MNDEAMRKAANAESLLGDRGFEKGWQAAMRYMAEQEPVAWAVFASNGNIRTWSTDSDPVRQLAEREGLRLTPLYAAPVPDRLRGFLECEHKWAIDEDAVTHMCCQKCGAVTKPAALTAKGE